MEFEPLGASQRILTRRPPSVPARRRLRPECALDKEFDDEPLDIELKGFGDSPPAEPSVGVLPPDPEPEPDLPEKWLPYARSLCDPFLCVPEFLDAPDPTFARD